MYKRVFPASMDYLHDMLDFIEIYCLNRGFDKCTVDKITLATEEAIVNIIHYGYPNKNGEIELSCEESPYKPGVRIFLKDQGVPFNPISKAEENRKKRQKKELLDFEQDIPLGGYGIYIFVGIMDRVEYQRSEHGNILSLVKYL